MNAKLVFILISVFTGGKVLAIPSLGSLLNHILGGDGSDGDGEDNIVKDITDTVTDTLTEVSGIVDELEGKWKTWVKNMNCTVRSGNLVTCTLTNKEAKDNPDSWRVSVSEVTIPNAPPKGCANITLPKKVDGDLFEWLSKFF